MSTVSLCKLETGNLFSGYSGRGEPDDVVMLNLLKLGIVPRFATAVSVITHQISPFSDVVPEKEGCILGHVSQGLAARGEVGSRGSARSPR